MAQSLAVFAPNEADPSTAEFFEKNGHQTYDESADGSQLFDEAVARAKAEGKHVIVVWGANWCGWCHHYDAVYANDPSLGAIVDEHFIKIEIDIAHRDKHRELWLRHGQKVDDLYIPHTSIHDAEGALIGALQPNSYYVGPETNRIYSGKKLARILEFYIPRD